MAKHIIIGGGSGFIGSALSKALRARGDRVTILSRTAGDHLSNEVRHVRVRIGIVLGKMERGSVLGRLWRIGLSRGLLPLIRLPFCFGLGARLGKGTQPFPWIHIDDMVGILIRVIDDEEATGRFNAVAPQIVSNAEFTAAFAHALRRPVVWSIPAWLLNWCVGPERASILLEGQKVVPKRTLALGCVFMFPNVSDAMTDLVEITV